MIVYGGKELAARSARSGATPFRSQGHPRGQVRVPRDAGHADGCRGARPRGLRDALWQLQAHGVDKKTFITFEDFGAYMARTVGEREQALTTKAQIIDALTEKARSSRVSSNADRSAAGRACQLPAADSTVHQDAVRDAARRQGARDAPPRQDDGHRAPARHRAAPDTRAAAAAAAPAKADGSSEARAAFEACASEAASSPRSRCAKRHRRIDARGSPRRDRTRGQRAHGPARREPPR